MTSKIKNRIWKNLSVVLAASLITGTMSFACYGDENPLGAIRGKNDESTEYEMLRSLNGGALPAIYDLGKNGKPTFINGRLSEGKVENEEDARAVIAGISSIIGISNVKDFLALNYKHTIDFRGLNDDAEATTFYRFQQYFDGVIVEDGCLILAVGSDGYAKALGGHYFQEEALRKTLPKTGVVGSREEGELVLKNCNGEIFLTRKTTQDGFEVYTDAYTGEVLMRIPIARGIAATGTGAGLDGVSVNFPVEKVEYEGGGYYLLYDSGDTGVRMYNAFIDSTTPGNNRNTVDFIIDGGKTETWARPLPMELGDRPRETVDEENREMLERWEVFSNDNVWGENAAEAITAYSTVMADRKWWKDTVNFDGSIGSEKPKDIYVVLNYPETAVSPFDYTGDMAEAFKEGYRPPMDNACVYKQYEPALMLQIGNADSYSEAADVLGHEFTHAMTNEISKLVYYMESGAIDEGYADVMGELFENTSLVTIGEDLKGLSGNETPYLRSFIDPAVCGNPVKYSDCSFDPKSDSGEVHKNSSIIYHAFYLLEQKLWEKNGITGNSSLEDKRTVAGRIARLLFNSMWYLPTDATFAGCRIALERAAKDQGWSDDEQAFLGQCFDEVGVTEPSKYDYASPGGDGSEGDTVSDDDTVTVSDDGLTLITGIEIGGKKYTLEYDSKKLVYTGKNLKKDLLALLKARDETGKEAVIKSIGVKKLKDVNGGGTLTKIKLDGQKPCKLASPAVIKITPFAVSSNSILDSSKIDKQLKITGAHGKKKTVKQSKGDYTYDAGKKLITFKGNYSGEVKLPE